MVEEREVGLGDYIRIIVKRYKFIVAFSFICVLITAAVSYFMPNTYQAEAMLLSISPPARSDLEFSTLSVQAYKELLKSPALIQKLMKKIGIKNISLEAFSNQSLRVELVEEARKGTEIILSPIIRLIVRTGDRAKADDIANTWAKLFIDSNSELYSKENSALYAYMVGQYNLAKKKLIAAKTHLNNLEQEYNFLFAKKEIENIENNIANYKKQLQKTELAIILQQSRLAALEEVLKTQQKYIVLSKAMVDEALWHAMTQPEKNNKLQKSKLKTEELNPIYQELQQQIADVKLDIYTQENQKKDLEKVIPEGEKELKVLNMEFFNWDTERLKLSLDISSYKLRCEKLGKKAEELSIPNGDKMTDMRVIAYAVEPEGKAGPNKKQNVVYSAILALIVAIFLAFIKEYIEKLDNEKKV